MIQPNEIHDIIRKHTIGDGENIVIDPHNSHDTHLVDLITGKSYLDCSSQFASSALGWNHSKLNQSVFKLGLAALHKYANSDYYSPEMAEFVQKFASIAPDFMYFFFVEGGALAVENALKAAIDWKIKKMKCTECIDENLRTQTIDIIHLEQAFHGRSGYTLSLTNTVPNKTALFPKFNWTRIKNPKITFPLVDSEVTESEEKSLRHAEEVLKNGFVAAIILETIQGEGGDNHFTPRYFAALRQLANKYEAMLILDEVQTGVGLTGKMWAYEHFGIVPDMIAFGKKTQVCGFASTSRIDEIPDNVFHISSRINSTWGGNIVDMVRFSSIIDIIKEDKLVENAAVIGEYFLEKLKTVPVISNVRGKGLMLAFDLNSSEKRNEVINKMQTKMTVLPCGERSIRLRPHLIFSHKDVDEAINIIKESV